MPRNGGEAFVSCIGRIPAGGAGNFIENSMNIDYVREIVGHEDINTTLNIYN